MKISIRSLFAVALVVLGGQVSGLAHAADWEMATAFSDETFHTQNIKQFASDVNTSSDGELNILVFLNQSRVKHADIKDAVSKNEVSLGEFYLSRLSDEDAVYSLDSLQFLATNYGQAARLWRLQKPAITELLAQQDLMPLFSVPWPPKGLYSNVVIKTISDIAGIRFRAYNDSLRSFAKHSGAIPANIPARDLPDAFANGELDAMLTASSNGVSTAAWDYVSHYYSVDSWLPRNIVVVNKTAFENLDIETQEVILAAAAKAEERGWKMSAAETADREATLKANGMDVQAPDAELTDGLRKIGVEMRREWEETASESAKAIVSAYESDL